MTAVIFFSVCLAVFQASGAPQHPNLPFWIHPSSMMNTQIRPLPAIEMNPASYLDPMPYQPPNQLPPMPFQVADQALIRNAFSDVDPRFEPFVDPEPYLDSGFELFRQNVNRECDPRSWTNRRSCSDSTTVRVCTLSGTYRYSQCPQSWSCAQGLGICLRPFRQQFAGRRSFTCPESPGTYPDPHSCKVYHVCSAEAGSKPETINCHFPQVYDPITQSCQMDTPDTPCYRIKCFGGQSALAYPGDPRIFVNCTRPGIVGSVSQCTNGDFAYNETSKHCDITHYCLREGNIPGPSDNQYYTCSRIFRRLVRSELKTCLGDLQFIASAGMCVGPSASALRADLEEATVPTGNDASGRLDEWTTDELVRALQESAFILKEEDDPEAAAHVRGKRIERSPLTRASSEYSDRRIINGRNEKSTDPSRLSDDDLVNYIM